MNIAILKHEQKNKLDCIGVFGCSFVESDYAVKPNKHG